MLGIVDLRFVRYSSGSGSRIWIEHALHRLHEYIMGFGISALRLESRRLLSHPLPRTIPVAHW